MLECLVTHMSPDKVIPVSTLACTGEGILPPLGCVAADMLRETAAESVDAVGPGGVSHA